ncbi:MAG: BPSS1780 family membrane protein [Burkholderiales bacterium]
MKLRSARPTDGARWMFSGLQMLRQQPLGHLAAASLMTFSMGLLLTLPWIGALLALVVLPALTVGWVASSTAVAAGQRLTPLMLLAPFRSTRRGVLLRLGVAYAVCGLAAFWLADLADPDFDTHWQAMMSSSADTPADLTRAAETMAAVQRGAVIRALAFLPVVLLFWHAPVIAWRTEAGVAKALFSSGLATLRNIGAFGLFGLSWLLADVVCSTLVATLLGLLGLGSAALVLIMPLGLMFLAAFYASLRATVLGCIEFDDPPLQA